MSSFESDTELEQVAGSRFRGVVSSGWNIGDNPNGGYLIALVSQAIGLVVKHPDPVSITTHYLRPGVGDEACEIEVELVRTGRTMTTARATMFQQGKSRIEVLAAFSDLSEAAGVDSDITIAAPDCPPPEECMPRTGDLQGLDIALVKKLDIMVQPELATPGASGLPEIAGWIRHADGRDPDARSLIMFCDCFPPSPLGALGFVGWVPSLELTTHVRRKPAPGWIQAHLRTDDLKDGRMVETGHLWDSTGALVAQSRQLALVRE